MEEEEVYKHTSTSSVNIATIILLVITTFTATYININNIRTTMNSSKTKSTRKYKKPLESSNATISTSRNTTNISENLENIVLKEKIYEEKKLNVKKRKSRKDTITNSYDKNIVRQLNEGEMYYKQKQYPECISFFEKLYKKYRYSPRAVYGQAICLDKLAEQMRSNEFLKKAIMAYGEVAKQPDVPQKLLKLSVVTQAKKYIFLGKTRESTMVLSELSKRLPNDVEVLNELGIAYMILGANKQAHQIFEKVLVIDPNNGIATVHIGFILKVNLNYKESIPYLLDGIRSDEPGTSDAKFYFHLGDAYSRLGQRDQAWKVYNEAAEKGVFLSALQRSTYNAETPLRAQPWWDVEETGYKKDIKLLEYHWRTIRDEALNILNKNKDSFPLETENLLDKGDWRQFELYARGQRVEHNCQKTPRTCAILDKMPSATQNTRGQIKFSIMEPGTHIWPHTGPTNCRLRAHLGLVIPKNVFIRVGSETRTWENGKVVIIDDSFDHEVWHNGTKLRMIFIVDFWHPDLPQWEKNTLSPI